MINGSEPRVREIYTRNWKLKKATVNAPNLSGETERTTIRENRKFDELDST